MNPLKSIKLLLKYFFSIFNFEIEKISDENKKEIQVVQNRFTEKNNINYLNIYSLKYPLNFTFEYEKFKYYFSNLDYKAYKHLKLFFIKKKRWIEKNIIFLNYDFVPFKLFYGSWGHAIGLNTLILANRYRLRKKRKIIFIQNKKLKFTNSILAGYFKEYINFLDEDNLEKGFIRLLRKVEIDTGQCIEFDDFALTGPEALNHVEQKRFDKKPWLKLKREHELEGSRELKKLKIKKNQWFVTMHIRQMGYKKEDNRNTSQLHRSPNPKNYIDAIKLITDRGGIVFLMGTNKYNFPKMKNFIIYSESKIKSELMDIFLAAKSKFSICNSSGFWTISKSFGTPVLLTDSACHTDYLNLSTNEMYLPRLFKSKKNDKYVNLVKSFSYPLNSLHHDTSFEKIGLEFIENTSQEISDAVQEMIHKHILKKGPKKISKLQQKFKLKFNKENNNKHVCLKAFANLPESFLRKNKHLI
ncbi:MAG: hypothetical protein FD544_000252 [Pelagibacterales bacterium]|nr:hypothetical protein [Pelagibacterales bacterium]